MNAFIVDADLRETKFFESNLEGASLRNSDLQGAHFGNANLKGARFQDADLRRAFFADADLTDSVLVGANLMDAIALRIEQLATARGLSKATMPDGSMYDGRLQLPYDIEYANREGYDPNSPQQMAERYGVSDKEYLEG